MLKNHENGLIVSDQGFVLRSSNASPLYGQDNGKGYLSVNVKCPLGSRHRSGKLRWFKKYVHILVMETFSPTTNQGLDVHHKNGNRQDNRLINLEWLNRGDNLEEAFMRRNRIRTLEPMDYLEEEDLHL